MRFPLRLPTQEACQCARRASGIARPPPALTWRNDTRPRRTLSRERVGYSGFVQVRV